MYPQPMAEAVMWLLSDADLVVQRELFPLELGWMLRRKRLARKTFRRWRSFVFRSRLQARFTNFGDELASIDFAPLEPTFIAQSDGIQLMQNLLQELRPQGLEQPTDMKHVRNAIAQPNSVAQGMFSRAERFMNSSKEKEQIEGAMESFLQGGSFEGFLKTMIQSELFRQVLNP